jgi:hypothetical protein
MEPEGSLLHSQVPTTCLYTEAAQSSPYPHTHFLKISVNIILPTLTLRFPHQNSVYTSPLAHSRYMLSPSHYSPFYHPHNIEWGVQIIKLHISAWIYRHNICSIFGELTNEIWLSGPSWFYCNSWKLLMSNYPLSVIPHRTMNIVEVQSSYSIFISFFYHY